jgi:DNA-binding NtrC family response regulator
MTLGIDRRTLYRKLQQYGVIVYGEESPLRRVL